MQMKGQITAQYENPKSLSNNPWTGPYSWLDGVIAELLSTYRALKIEDDRIKSLEKELLSLMGLDEKASKEQIKATVAEIRAFFIEMRRIQGERAGRVGNET